MYGRGQHNIVKQLSSNEKEEKKNAQVEVPLSSRIRKRGAASPDPGVAKPGQHPQKTSFGKGT